MIWRMTSLLCARAGRCWGGVSALTDGTCCVINSLFIHSIRVSISFGSLYLPALEVVNGLFRCNGPMRRLAR